MGKKLIAGLYILFIGALITGLVYGNIFIITSVNGKAKADFERRDELIFLNGTVSEIHYDFEDSLWIEINNSKLYNLYPIFKVNSYIEESNIDNLLNDVYYLMEVNDIFTIYYSGRCSINNRTIINTAYDDLENFWLGLAIPFTFIDILGGVIIIAMLIGGLSRIDDMDSKNKSYYKERSEQWKELCKKKTKEIKNLKKELSTNPYKPENLNIQYCHECGSKVKGNHCNYCGAEVRK